MLDLKLDFSVCDLNAGYGRKVLDRKICADIVNFIVKNNRE